MASTKPGPAWGGRDHTRSTRARGGQEGDMRRGGPSDGYRHSSRPFIAEIAFRGRFHQVREQLYFRRDHPNRGDRNPTIPALCTNLDPRRAGQGTIRLVAEYAYRYFEAVARAPI